MRVSYHGNIITNSSEENCGINLGSDFCAEHEFGIEDIRTMFGIDNTKIGFSKRKVEKIPDKNHFDGGSFKYSNKNYFFLYLSDFSYKIEECSTINEKAKYFKMMPNQYYPKDIGFEAQWDEMGFAILFYPETAKIGEEIFEAIKEKNALVFVNGTKNPFIRGGLHIYILSKLDKDFLDDMDKSDKDEICLRKAAEKTGIYKILNKAGKKFFALSPRWTDNTKKDVKFWLNPYEQHLYNYGWYSVEDLKLWAKNKGPIIKN